MQSQKQKPQQSISFVEEGGHDRKIGILSGLRRKRIKDSLRGTGIVAAGTVAVGAWDSTAPLTYTPAFQQAFGLLKKTFGSQALQAIGIVDGNMLYQALIMGITFPLTYFGLYDKNRSKKGNLPNMLAAEPSMAGSDGVSASLSTNDTTHTMTINSHPNPLADGRWRTALTQHTPWLHSVAQWINQPSYIPINGLNHGYDLAIGLIAAFAAVKLFGYKWYDRWKQKHQRKKLAEIGAEIPPEFSHMTPSDYLGSRLWNK